MHQMELSLLKIPPASAWVPPDVELHRAAWSEAEHELAIASWLAGKGEFGTAKFLNERFGNGRKQRSVINWMHRANLSGYARAPVPAAPRKAPSPKASARRKVGVAAPAPAVLPSAPAPRPASRPPAGIAILESLRVAFVDIRDDMCRWIAGEPDASATCCGRPVD